MIDPFYQDTGEEVGQVGMLFAGYLYDLSLIQPVPRVTQKMEDVDYG